MDVKREENTSYTNQKELEKDTCTKHINSI